MSHKLNTHRDSTSNSSNAALENSKPKARSSINLSDSISEKSSKKQTTGDAPHSSAKPTPRAKYVLNPPVIKKPYMKNSEKCIKPPDRPLKPTSISKEEPPAVEPKAIQKGKTTFIRATSHIPINAHTNGGTYSKERSSSDNLGPHKPVPFARVDSKTIDELEKRLENLQTILMTKLEVLRSRAPEKLKKEYKFVAMVIDDEAKLIVKENDIRRIPNHIPAKSVCDLQRKAGEFFTGCLLSFIDKLRLYQQEERPINCDEICEELKGEQKELCGILEDWISEFCDDADVTLTTVQPEDQKVDNETQTEAELLEEETKEVISDLEEELNKLREDKSKLENDLEEKENLHRLEINELREKNEFKLLEMTTNLEQKDLEIHQKEEEIMKEKEDNENVMKKLATHENRLKELEKKNEVLLAQVKQDTNLKAELCKLREEMKVIQNENSELKECKGHFLKKLDQRFLRIELLEKEVKQQKRLLESKTQEYDDLREEFDAKVKENRRCKESLDARNKIIDHLRSAVDILEKKQGKGDNYDNQTLDSSEQFGEELDDKLMRSKGKFVKNSVTPGGQTFCATGNQIRQTDIKNNKFSLQVTLKGPSDISDYSMEMEQQQRSVDKFDLEKSISSESLRSVDIARIPPFNVKNRKRNRDIIVKKYEI